MRWRPRTSSRRRRRIHLDALGRLSWSRWRLRRPAARKPGGTSRRATRRRKACRRWTRRRTARRVRITRRLCGGPGAGVADEAADPIGQAADDTQVLRMDIPALGVDGACVSVIGQLGKSRGVLSFASHDDFEAFVAAAESGAIEQSPLDQGAGWLALTFEPATELPASMRREAMEHGWPVERADGYPLAGGAARPGRHAAAAGRARRRDRRRLRAVVRRVLRQTPRAIFESDAFAPVCESYFDDDDREVRFTAPCEALADFELPNAAAPGLDTLAPAEAFRPRAGRNASCPCGSGRKYKKCHLAAGRGRARRPAGRGRGARDGREPRETPVGVRPAGVGRGLGSVRGRFRRPRRGAVAGIALVGLLLRGRGGGASSTRISTLTDAVARGRSVAGWRRNARPDFRCGRSRPSMRA